MKKQIPKAKVSKKTRRALALAGRRTWGTLSPVTRKIENPMAYNRRKVQKGVDELRFEPSFMR